MNRKTYRIVCMGNGYLSGLGGGLVRTLALVKYLKIIENANIIVHCAPGVEKYFKDLNLTSNEIIVHKFLVSKYISEKFVYISLIFYYLETILFFPKIKTNKNEIIYSQTEYIWDILSSLRIKSLNGKYICMFHHIIDKDNIKSFSIFASYISQIFSIYIIKKRFDQINIYDSQSGNFINRLFMDIPTIKIKRVNNGIWINDIRNVLNESRNNKIQNIDMLFIGGIRPQKGLEIIDEFIATCIKFLPKIRIQIIGSTPQPIATRLIKTYSNNLSLIKGLSQIEVYEKISNARLCFSPSQTEGFGIAILEALSMEKDVVCLPLPVLKGIYSEFIHYSDEITGKSLALKCINVLNKKDRNNNKNLSEFVAKFDWQQIFDSEFNHE